MRARSCNPTSAGYRLPSSLSLTVSMLPTSSRTSSAVSTGVLPFLTPAARCCLTVGGVNSACSSLTKAATLPRARLQFVHLSEAEVWKAIAEYAGGAVDAEVTRLVAELTIRLMAPTGDGPEPGGCKFKRGALSSA